MDFIDLFENIESIEKKAYLKYTILYHGAPTFYANKPSTVITFNKFGINMYGLWKMYKKDFIDNILYKYIELFDNGKRCTVLFYHEKNLINTIYCKDNMEFLQRYGYNSNMSILEILNYLKIRYYNFCPHEIGIFLGFPVKDVKEFIYGEKSNYLLCGYWKVYHDLEEAKKIFTIYDEAKKFALENIISKEGF